MKMMKKMIYQAAFMLLGLFLSVHTSAQIVLNGLDDGSAGSLRQVIMLAPAGSEITFGPLVTNVILMAEITIDKDLVITGLEGDGTTLDMQGNGRIFNITAGTVALNNLSLVNGLADDGGGIYNANASLTLTNCSISQCTADGASGSGGAIFNAAGGTLTIIDSEISFNQANRAGGGIEDQSGAGLGVILTNVVLNNNNTGVTPATPAPGNGGAVHITGPGDILVTNCTVNDNTAALEGGGLWNGTGTMTVSGGWIDGNTAAGAMANEGGGGLFNAGGTLVVQDSCVITNNMATGAAGSGGGILNDLGVLSVFDSEISGNVSVRAGGGIEDNSMAGNTLVLTNVTLSGNSTAASPGNGGGLHITGPGNSMITGCTVTDNTAALEGGGLWNGTGTMTVSGGWIDGNTAAGAMANEGGGGLFNAGGTLVVQDSCVITNNMATGAAGSGGGILNDLGVLSVFDSEISGNVSVRAGGGIEDNSMAGNTLVLTNVTLSGNSTGAAPGNGGGLHITGPGNSTITGGIFNDNFAALEGGGLWNGTGTMTVAGATISGNTAAGATAGDGGGGIFNNGGTVNVSMSTVSNNAATGAAGSGGGIFNTTGGNFMVMLSTVSGNSAATGGGILHAGNAFAINASTIAMNTATAMGGGIHAGQTTQLKNTIVASNTAMAGTDVAGMFTSDNYNLIGSDDAGAFPEQAGDIEGQDAKLMPLSTNGMATATHRLDIGSPAYNSGDPADNFADQSGQAVFGGRRDIGSDEAQTNLTNTVVVSLSESGIRVFPNPAHGQTTVSIPATFGSNTRLELFELGSGKLVREYSGVSGTAQLDLGNLNAGMYTLRITSDSLITAGKVTVIR